MPLLTRRLLLVRLSPTEQQLHHSTPVCIRRLQVHYIVQIGPDVFVFWPVSAPVAFLLNRRDHQCNNNTSGKTRTFKPRKDVPEGTKQYQLRKYAEATLVSPSLSSLLINSTRSADLRTRSGFRQSSFGGATARRRGY